MKSLHPEPTPARSLRIDAHHHLWRYRANEFEWINSDMKTIRRDFLPSELRSELQHAGLDGSIAVQARSSFEETQWLLECASSEPLIRGVVGWVDLSAEDLSQSLERLRNASRLIGLREIVQDLHEGYLDANAFNRGIKHLTRLGLAYDILIRQARLVEATRLVDRHPRQTFVLDHAGKPMISKGELEPWRKQISELARRPNVSCKISGLATEATWDDWSLSCLRPYLDTCVNAFGTDRLLAGSDWPVCLLASGYSQWWDVLERYFEGFTPSETERIFGGNALRIYRISTGA